MLYLSQVQGDVHLVELCAARKRRALPPPLRAIDGIGDGVGAVTVALAADVTVLTLRRNKKEIKVTISGMPTPLHTLLAESCHQSTFAGWINKVTWFLLLVCLLPFCLSVDQLMPGRNTTLAP